MDIRYPARDRFRNDEHPPSGTDQDMPHQGPGAAAAAPGHGGYPLHLAQSEEDHSTPPAEQPSWHLWGMMVGFMAAGAAILTILSFTAT
ncbi:hypothetical protein [Aquabacter spiritensis]|uniref:Uncharacterized protein n=1 Tax=Aquabacter spiritensis TaxID=933073 RepID=A0A4R3LZ59_9HYPH|nr:hypothetical protein [Aquabacter spiritensis]TCT06031.1 hypothetical protein EDC64_103134 [Aquabacter spiritensis]